MKDKKQIVSKIISVIFVFSLFITFSQFLLPTTTSAASGGLNWDNPNSNAKNPFKINTDAILNSQTLMKVVGCTGIVDKVTTLSTDFLKNQANKLVQKIWKSKAEKLGKTNSCEAVKAALVASMASIINTSFSLAVESKIDCKRIQETSNPDLLDQMKKDAEIEIASKKREECFNGLAYTLSKNQLTSMTRQTINWVNSGFNGNPMYVQNITSLTNSIGKNVLERGVEQLANGAFPYGSDFSRSLIRQSRAGGIDNGGANFLGNLTSDLAAFITDPVSLGINSGNLESKERTAKQRAQEANDRFANDFSVGGWDGYMALTQREANNPLGFTMLATQKIADNINRQANETKEELAQNDGFLSQKTCTKWQIYEKEGKPAVSPKYAFDTATSDKNKYSETKTSEFDVCVPGSWNVVTPGSIIKDKLSTYINSPERQLELADTINKSLNSLFTKLIENFRDEGLFGLSQEGYSYNGNDNMGAGGYGSNIGAGYDGDFNYGTDSEGYINEEFDLTRDLGNTFDHQPAVNLGNWNASVNTPELHVGLAPYDEKCNGYCTQSYYTVSRGGDTKLFNNGYSGWAIGDRAYWNGKEWQNWKKGVASPIAIRGVIQTQKDYVVAAKEVLKILPSIMPKLGELDYCIPGPNPYFVSNAGETAGAFNEYAGSLQSMYKDGSFFKRDTTSFSIAKPGQTAYDDYRNVFMRPQPLWSKQNPIPWSATLWSAVQQSMPWKALQFLGALGEIKKDRAEGKATEQVDVLVNSIQNDIKVFYSEYTENVFTGVYKTMQLEFIEMENRPELVANKKFVPMINDGYSLTKDILNHNEDTLAAIDDYKAAIILAESNTLKLNAIKSEVSKIIKAAQDRRDARLLVQINELHNLQISICKNTQIDCNNGSQSAAQCQSEYNSCIREAGGVLTVAQYKTKYASCFEEENILYYDASDIMNDTGGDESKRCFDNIDNDLDGKIDKLDPDCK